MLDFFDDVWLVAFSRGEGTTGDLRDELREVVPGTHMIVLGPISGDDSWSAFGSTDAFKWMHDYWKDA